MPESLFNKVKEPAALFKRRLPRRSYLTNFHKFYKNTFVHRTPPAHNFLTLQNTIDICLTLLFG